MSWMNRILACVQLVLGIACFVSFFHSQDRDEARHAYICGMLFIICSYLLLILAKLEDRK